MNENHILAINSSVIVFLVEKVKTLGRYILKKNLSLLKTKCS